MDSKSSRSRGSIYRPRAASRNFHPRVEALELRSMLAGDPLLFIEDFSRDGFPYQPSFDRADDDPFTETDRLLIQHDISGRDYNFFQLGDIHPASTFQPSAGLALGILGPGSDVIQLPPRSTPGGLGIGEEITSVAIGYSGLGVIRFIGDNGVITHTFFEPPSVWHSITVTANSPSDTGQELGAILRVEVSTFEIIYIDDIALLVNGIIVNNPPIANLDATTTLPGTPVEIDALANDGDADGDAIALYTYFQPPHGSVSFQDSTFLYTPDPGFHGIDSFDYVVTDGRIPAGSDVRGTVRITVNTPPPALLISIPIPHGFTGPYTFDLSAHLPAIVDADGDPLTVATFNQTQYFGSLVRNANGSFTYFPSEPGGLVPTGDRFEFRLSDTFVVGTPGLAFLDVDNAAPIAQSQVFHLDHGTPGPLRGILHFTDADGDPLDLMPIDLPIDPFTGFFRTANGRLELNDGESLQRLTSDIEFIYHPIRGDFRGDDRFTFRVTDLYDARGIGTIEFRVPNYRPEVVIPNGHLELIIDGGISLARPGGGDPATGHLFDRFDDVGFSTLRAPDPNGRGQIYAIDLDHDSLTGVLADPPAHGTVALEGDGNFTYTPDPAAGLFGTDTFSFRVSDGAALSDRVIYVTIKQSLGQGFAGSDVYWTEDDESQGEFGHKPDPIVIDYRTLLLNDRLETNWNPNFVIRGLRINRAGQPVFRANSDLERIDPLLEGENQFVRLDEVIIYTPISHVNVGQISIDIFEYQFLYSPPGLPESATISELSASTWGKVMVVIHDEVEGDSDGVYDVFEEHGPHDGDGNSDGVQDAIQPHVTSLPMAPLGNIHDRYITFETGGRHSLVGVKAIPSPLLSDMPASAQFPLGFFSFQVLGLTPREATTVRLILSELSSYRLTDYYKYGHEPLDDPATPNLNERYTDHWYSFNFDGRTGAEFIRRADGTVREVIMHFVDGERGDDDVESNGIIRDPGAAVLLSTAPTIDRVVINDGHAQRSKVNSIDIEFSEVVTIQPGAFEVRRIGARNPLKLDVQLTSTAGRTVARLTFKKGAGVVGGSVADGRYRLTIRGDKVRDSDGRLLDGDADGALGGNHVDEFFRRFGDTDGDGDVDAVDRLSFNSAFGKRLGQPGYVSYLDFNRNGRVGTEDLAAFWLAYTLSKKGR